MPPCSGLLRHRIDDEACDQPTESEREHGQSVLTEGERRDDGTGDRADQWPSRIRGKLASDHGSTSLGDDPSIVAATAQ